MTFCLFFCFLPAASLAHISNDSNCVGNQRLLARYHSKRQRRWSTCGVMHQEASANQNKPSHGTCHIGNKLFLMALIHINQFSFVYLVCFKLVPLCRHLLFYHYQMAKKCFLSSQWIFGCSTSSGNFDTQVFSSYNACH